MYVPLPLPFALGGYLSLTDKVCQVDIFKPAAPRQLGTTNRNNGVVARRAQVADGRTKQGGRPRGDALPKPWTGSNKYNRVCEIGRGAFATVHKVTMKLTGQPYAAKELDKRKFMKNGVLDQKVENEMRIMQRIKHVRRNLPLPGKFWTLLTFLAAKHRGVHRAFRLG